VVRELDERLGFGELIQQHLTDSRRGKNTQFAFVASGEPNGAPVRAAETRSDANAADNCIQCRVRCMLRSVVGVQNGNSDRRL
jgi:hypothetical protein